MSAQAAVYYAFMACRPLTVNHASAQVAGLQRDLKAAADAADASACEAAAAAARQQQRLAAAEEAAEAASVRVRASDAELEAARRSGEVRVIYCTLKGNCDPAMTQLVALESRGTPDPALVAG